MELILLGTDCGSFKYYFAKQLLCVNSWDISRVVHYLTKADVFLLCCLHSLVLTFSMPHSKQLLFAANFPLCCMHFIWRLACCAIQPKPALVRPL